MLTRGRVALAGVGITPGGSPCEVWDGFSLFTNLPVLVFAIATVPA